MIGGNKTPFRLPCGGVATAGQLFLGIPNHKRAAPVPAYGNTTQMKDHCGNTIPATLRKTQLTTCGDDICSPDCDDCPGGTNLITNTPNPPAISENTWSAATGTVQLEPTEKIGGKWAQAFKNWHGRFGLLHQSDTGADCTSGDLSNTKYLTVTRELTMNWTVGFFGPPPGDPCGPGPFRADGTIHLKTVFTVDAHTGVIVKTTSTFEQTRTGTGDEGDEYGGLDPSTLLYTDLVCSAWQAAIDALAAQVVTDTVAGKTASSSGSISDTEFVTSFSSYKNFTFGTFPDSETVPVGVDYELTVTLSDENTTDDVFADAIAQVNLWSLVDDLKYPFRIDFHTTVGPIVVRNEKAAPVNPDIKFIEEVDDFTQPATDGNGNAPFSHAGDSGQSGAAIQDANNNAPHSKASDPGQLPDNSVDPCTPVDWVPTFDPTPIDWVPTWEKIDWFDPDAFVFTFAPGTDQFTAAALSLDAIYDGAFIGAPLTAGYGQPVGGNPRGVFDRDHVNWFRRNCDPGVGWTQGNESLGAFTPDFLPSNAQKWTDDFHATTLWPCAFLVTDVSGVYLQKWCEAKLKRPSIDFARPFGPDKFMLDETAVYYVSDFTAGVVTLQDTTFHTVSSLPFTTSDIVGSAAVGGFYSVTSVGTNTVTLGIKLSDLPAGWNTPSGDGAQCFGKLRFPLITPGMDFIDPTAEIGGRVAITVTNGTPVTLTTATIQKYLSLGVNDEEVDILDANMTALATDVDLTRVDDTHFTVTTSFATIAAAKWIVPHVLSDGATSGQKYKFADDKSKGDYVFRTWTIRISDSVVLATSQTDDCLPFSPCGPSVAGISPNGETSTLGKFWDFPGSVNQGEVWLGQIQFWMQDPFWQTPHTPVDVGDPDFDRGVDSVQWNEDNGDCNEDSTEVGGGGETIYHRFYAMRPYVEARCSLPNNVDGETAPALASGVDLTTVQDPPNQAGVGDVDGPLVNAINVPTPYWIKMLAQRGCVNAAGRFAQVYEDNGTTP